MNFICCNVCGFRGTHPGHHSFSCPSCGSQFITIENYEENIFKPRMYEEPSEPITIKWGGDGVMGMDLAQMDSSMIEKMEAMIKAEIMIKAEMIPKPHIKPKPALPKPPEVKKDKQMPDKPKLNYPALRAYLKLMRPVWLVQGIVERWMMTLDIPKRTFKQYLYEESVGVETRIGLLIGMTFGFARLEELEEEFKAAINHEDTCKEIALENTKSKN